MTNIYFVKRLSVKAHSDELRLTCAAGADSCVQTMHIHTYTLMHTWRHCAFGHFLGIKIIATENCSKQEVISDLVKVNGAVSCIE